MAGVLKRFQTTTFNFWGDHVGKENHLGEIFRLEPQRATDFMVQLLAYNRGRTLDTFLSQFPEKEFDDDREYYWDVVASSRRNVPLIEARDENGKVVTADSDNVGVGFAPFYLVFGEEWFFDQDVIWGNLNQVYPIQVKESPKYEGTNCVYRCQMFGGNPDGIPAERLLAGERFSRGYDPVEREFSRKVGGLHFAAPVRVMNEFSTIRMHYKVGGAMLNKKLAVGIPIEKCLPNGKTQYDTTDMWMHYVDWEFEQEFNEMKNNVLAWGVSNRDENGEYFDFGKSGHAIKTGAGLMEQMEAGNTTSYNQFMEEFDIRIINDALYNISSKLPMDQRYFVLKTGEKGAIQFHMAVKKDASGWLQAPFIINSDSLGIVSRTTSEMHKNSLQFGAQFSEWLGPNGVHVRVEVDPFYDDEVHNKILHPKGGVAYSYRYDLFSLTTPDADVPFNIYKCKIKGDAEYRGYQWGLRNPFDGSRNNPYMSFDEDAAVIHRMATLGICVQDPLRTVSIIPCMLS